MDDIYLILGMTVLLIISFFLIMVMLIPALRSHSSKEILKKRVIALTVAFLTFCIIELAIYFFTNVELTSLGLFLLLFIISKILKSIFENWDNEERIKKEQREKSEYIKEYNRKRHEEMTGNSENTPKDV